MTRTLFTAAILIAVTSIATIVEASVPHRTTSEMTVAHVDTPAMPGRSEMQPSPATLTADQQELVDFAYSRYARAGLVLPDVSVMFPDDESQCFGYGGIYVPNERTVRICRPSKTTMVHELAHAWLETVLVESDRRDFLELRGLETWRGGPSWGLRGAEQSAEIITWALMDTDISVRWMVTNSDGTTTNTWRLFKVPNSSPVELVAAYENLTDRQPSDRLDDVPSSETLTAVSFSPEARPSS